MYSTRRERRIRQGDIYQNFIYDLSIPIPNRINKIRFEYPFVMVISQDCDLLRDYEIKYTNKENKNDANRLFTVLVCPLFNSDQFKEGSHLKAIGLNCKPYNRELWNPIKKNECPRVHLLKSDDELGFPELVMDFKQYFTFPIDTLYRIRSKLFKARVKEIYREQISQRFSNYLSRIPLPD